MWFMGHGIEFGLTFKKLALRCYQPFPGLLIRNGNLLVVATQEVDLVHIINGKSVHISGHFKQIKLFQINLNFKLILFGCWHHCLIDVLSFESNNNRDKYRRVTDNISPLLIIFFAYYFLMNLIYSYVQSNGILANALLALRESREINRLKPFKI